ncbi:ABC transporter ATP-binding protein [Pelagibacterium sediminicola]|uniref:ABC transporter ATP-binding protein n=1 Tax=Pelagibacterium sediminicola TaxID=2248761 RepID=UPI000E31DF31|nr:ATP-binding cassette domain-containing protein [Pelagibacterium sediminicola]
MTLLTLHDIGHAFFGRTILEGIDLAVGPGEIVSLLGPSGSGKSTIAHIAAGLIDQKEGRVARCYQRHAMVFQEPRLMYWATVGENIGFPLRLMGTPRRHRAQRIEAAAIRAGLLPEDLEKFPVELSGGMRQRAAIARALVNEPDFIYFDEPFSALDVALKRRMQDLVIASSAGERFGALFITHDIMEAIRISHRILVLAHDGQGIAGERRMADEPGKRSEEKSFALRQAFLDRDPLFAHIHEIDERARP